MLPNDNFHIYRIHLRTSLPLSMCNDNVIGMESCHSFDKLLSNNNNMILSKQIFGKQRNYQGLLYLFKTRAAFASNGPAKIIFENNLNLPLQPVPKLEQTVEKYIKSVIPFLNASELSKTKEILNKFTCPNSDGPKLQKLLEERAKNTENWLSDWWLNVAYLEYRDPVTLYSSPGLIFPFQKFKNEADRLNYTAELILAALTYKIDIYSDKLPIDKMGKDPLDMNQYKKIFGTIRSPGEKRDILDYNPDSRHIIVAMNNNFFKLEVINLSGEIPSLKQLVSCLETIVKGSKEQGCAVGVLTSEHRDNWYKAYCELMKDPLNKKTIQEIETSLFLVCLDESLPECDSSQDDERRTGASKLCIHGGGSQLNSANRWFDKTIQFTIGDDGTTGLTYEHSPSEGVPIAVMTDFLIKSIKSRAGECRPDVKINCCPQKLTFNVNEKIMCHIENACNSIDKLVDNVDIDSFKYTTYGKNFIKKQKLSPDSYIQIAMQYAYFRIHKTPGAHYESAALRKYIHGRTETIRSCSVESVAFAKTMLEKNASNNDKLKALKVAVQAHKKYSVEAVLGYGVDRHLLGLKLIAMENCIPLPAIYKDPSFTRSTHMRLATSQVATKCDGFMCYGPLAHDGYGCCYNPRDDEINFGVTAFRDHPQTSATAFRKALECSLQEIHDMFPSEEKCKL